MYISTRVVLGCGFGVAATSLIEQILISEKDKVLVVASLGVSFAEALVSAEILVVDKEDANLFAEEATRRRGTAPQDIHQGGAM